MKNIASSPPLRLEGALTLLIGLLVLAAAGTGVFVPGFYDGIVDPTYATGTITSDVFLLLSVPLLALCVWQARRGSVAGRLSWIALLTYIGYTYAHYAFDRMYTALFLVYVAIFSLSGFALTPLLAGLDVTELAARVAAMPLRRVTAGFLVFTGLILYAIELPILLARIPDGIGLGGTPFMVLDMAFVAPLSILTGVWVWQRRPWGAALIGVFLIKAITLMSGFLIADYIDWFAGRLAAPEETLAFTFIYVGICFFTWNYFTALSKGAHTGVLKEAV